MTSRSLHRRVLVLSLVLGAVLALPLLGATLATGTAGEGAALQAPSLLQAVLAPRKANAQPSVMPAELEGVDVDERLDKPLPLDAYFRDHNGKLVYLRDYFDGKR